MTDTHATRKGFLSKLKWLGALGSFVAGLVIGPYASELVVRTNPGFFGPGNQSIIDEQQENFSRLEETLAELATMKPGDSGNAELVARLTTLLEEQRTLAEKKDELFKATDIAGQAMKEELLKKKGVAGAVDFFIKPGESMVLRDPNQVFSVLRGLSGNRVSANLSGTRSQLMIGDAVEFEVGSGPCKVFYRQDDRNGSGYGFDLVCD